MNSNMTIQTPLQVGDQKSIPSSLYQALIHPPSLLLQQNMMNNLSENKGFGVGNGNVNGMFTSTGSTLHLPHQNQTMLFPFSTSSSFDTTTCSSSNVYYYGEEFKTIEEPIIPSTKPWEIPAASTSGGMVSVIYLCLLYGMYVPDWEYEVPTEPSSEPMKFSVKCGVRGDTGPACNVVGMIDRSLLGLQHLYRRPIYARTPECSINSPDYGPLPPDAPSWCQAPFDPEGLLSSVMAIVTCLVGLHYGHIILHFKDHRIRILHWMIPTSCLVVSGIALDLFGMHVNKVLYSFSYTCLTAGAAGILFAGIYLMVDVCGYSRMTSIFQWIGMHALMIYVLAACNIFPIFLQGFYWGNPHNNILKLIGVGS